MAKWRRVLKKEGIPPEMQQNLAIDVSPEQISKSKEIIDSRLTGLPYFALGDLLTIEHPKFIERYIGGFINSGDGLLTLGVCVGNKAAFRYVKNHEIILAYTESKKLYIVTAKIEGIREIQKKDLDQTDISGEKNAFQDQVENLRDILDTCRFYIINVCILTEPQSHQRRTHQRVEVSWLIYFKIAAKDKELEAEQEKWIANKKFDMKDGYFKTETVDVSAGGFKSVINVQIPTDTGIECIIEAGSEKINVKGKIVGCAANHADNERFDMRVQFMNLSAETLENLTKNIQKKIEEQG